MYPTKGDALAWAREQERKVRRGEWTDPTLSRVTVAEWSEQWLGTLVVKPKTRDSYESLLMCHVLPRWGSVRLERVTLADVKAWIPSLATKNGKPLSASRTKQAYQVLSMMLDLAVEDGRLPRNPARPSHGRMRGMLPTIPKNSVRKYLTPQQLEALAEAAGEYGALIRTLGYTGLRWGEASALMVSDVDILNRRIHVRRAISDIKGQLIFGTPKTHAMRSVPITSSLASELEQLIFERPASDPLFTAPNGGWLHLRNFRYRDFDPAVKAAGLHSITPHTLRHTAASIAVSADANVKAVQRMLGHASAAMTLDVYADLFDDDLDTLADRLETTASAARADYLRTGTGVIPLHQDSIEAARAADLQERLVGPVGLEPTTRGLKVRCSAN
jgi:integrase